MPAAEQQKQHAVERAAKIYGVLKAAAERGSECPENGTLAERFSCSPGVIVRSLHYLEANGMIRVERGIRPRVVTIIATGKKTALIPPYKVKRKAR